MFRKEGRETFEKMTQLPGDLVRVVTALVRKTSAGPARCRLGVGRPRSAHPDDPGYEERRSRGTAARGPARRTDRAALARREVKRSDGTVFLSPWIFHRQGKRVRKFSRVFANARAAAGVSQKTVHDFRRTALRDFIRAGVHQHVAMQMSGHRSASVFRRYDIVDVEDVRLALRKTEHYRETRTETDNQRIARL